MTVLPKSINPSPESNGLSDLGQISNKSSRSQMDEKIPRAIPEHIAKPEEKHTEQVTIEFTAKVIAEEHEETIKTANGLGHEILNLLHESSPKDLVQISNPNNLNKSQQLEDVQEDLFPNLDSEELSEEEIAAMLAALDNADLQLDTENHEIVVEKQEIVVEKQETVSNNQEIDANKQKTEGEVEKHTESISIEKVDVGEKSQETTKVDSKISATQSEAFSIKNDNKNPLSAMDFNISKLKDINSIQANDKKAENAFKTQQLLKQLDKNIKELEDLQKTNPTPEGLEALNKTKENMAALKDQINQGKSNEAILGGIKNAQGVSLLDMDMDDFTEALKNLNTFTFNFAPSASDSDIKKDEKPPKETKERDLRPTERKKNESPKEKLDPLLFALSQGRISETIHQQIRDKAKHIEEKLEAINEKNITIIKEDTRNKEIKKKGIEDSQDLKDQLDSEKLTESIKFMLNSARSIPVRKETLHMVVSVIRTLDSIPGGKNDPELNSLQKALIHLHSDIKQAVGVDSVGGTGTAPQVRTK